MIKRYVAIFVILFLGFMANDSLAEPLTQETLQGTWSGSNGQDTLTLTFMANACLLRLNSQQMPGQFFIFGNNLQIQFQNGKVLSYQAMLAGNSLILDGSVYLTRQMSHGPVQTPGPTFNPQPMPQQVTPLEGLWSVRIPEGIRSFRFTNNQYAQLLNGRVVEAGLFRLTPDGVLHYTVTQGQFIGQTGEDRVFINGNQLTVSWPDGTVITFMRDNSANMPNFPQPMPQPW